MSGHLGGLPADRHLDDEVAGISRLVVAVRVVVALCRVPHEGGIGVGRDLEGLGLRPSAQAKGRQERQREAGFV